MAEISEISLESDFEERCGGLVQYRNPSRAPHLKDRITIKLASGRSNGIDKAELATRIEHRSTRVSQCS